MNELDSLKEHEKIQAEWIATTEQVVADFKKLKDYDIVNDPVYPIFYKWIEVYGRLSAIRYDCIIDLRKKNIRSLEERIALTEENFSLKEKNAKLDLRQSSIFQDVVFSILVFVNIFALTSWSVGAAQTAFPFIMLFIIFSWCCFSYYKINKMYKKILSKVLGQRQSGQNSKED